MYDSNSRTEIPHCLTTDEHNLLIHIRTIEQRYLRGWTRESCKRALQLARFSVVVKSLIRNYMAPLSSYNGIHFSIWNIPACSLGNPGSFVSLPCTKKKKKGRKREKKLSVRDVTLSIPTFDSINVAKLCRKASMWMSWTYSNCADTPPVGFFLLFCWNFFAVPKIHFRFVPLIPYIKQELWVKSHEIFVQSIESISCCL